MQTGRLVAGVALIFLGLGPILTVESDRKPIYVFVALGAALGAWFRNRNTVGEITVRRIAVGAWLGAIIVTGLMYFAFGALSRGVAPEAGWLVGDAMGTAIVAGCATGFGIGMVVAALRAPAAGSPRAPEL
jgi:hypothetical protein